MVDYAGANEALQSLLSRFLPENLVHVASGHFLVTIAIISILFIIVLLGIALFFDFVTDVWKIPLAIAVDAMKFIGLTNPGFAIGSSVASVVVFIFLSDAAGFKWGFAIIGLLFALGVLFLSPAWAALLALIPINTLMMFVSTIVD